MVDLRDEMKFRQSLFDKVEQAISEGAKEISGSDWEKNLGNDAMFDQILANAKAGRPMLEGMSLWRGSKDPDVDSGTFGEGWRHGTINAHEALGYASMVNIDIGFNPKSVTGFGVVARYPIDPSTVFFRNFAIEDGKPGKDLAEVERELAPLVEKVVNLNGKHYTSPDYPHPDVTALKNYLRETLYETQIPYHVQPEEKWLVAPNTSKFVPGGGQAHTSEFRLIPLNEQSPAVLHEVSIDLVRARGMEILTHKSRTEVSHFLNEIKGLSEPWRKSVTSEQEQRESEIHVGRLQRVVQAFTQAMDPMLQDHGKRPATLQDAIEARRIAQSGMELRQLSNSKDPRFVTGSPLDPVAEDLEYSLRLAQATPRHQRLVESDSLMQERCKALLKASNGMKNYRDMVSSAETRLKDLVQQRDEKKAELRSWRDKLEVSQQVLDKAGSNIFKRLYYATLGSQQLSTWQERHSYLGREIAEAQGEFREIKRELDENPKQKARLVEAHLEHSRQYDEVLSELKRDEDRYSDYFNKNHPCPSSSDIRTALEKIEEHLSKRQEFLSMSLAAEAKVDMVLQGVDRGKPLVQAWRDANVLLDRQRQVEAPEHDGAARRQPAMATP